MQQRTSRGWRHGGARFAILASALAITALGCAKSQSFIPQYPEQALKNKTLRIATYNILAGGETKQGDAENRGELLRSVIEDMNPDVIGLNECNNWHRENVNLLKVYEDRFGMVGILPIKHGSGVAALVRRGIPILQVLGDTQRQGHALSIVTIVAPDGKPLKIFITHMIHTNPPARMKELNEIVRYIGPGERCILMGDLNSISGRDNPPIADVPKGELKRFMEGDKLHTGVIGGLEDAGLVDVYRKLHPNQGPNDNTVGTKMSKDPAHAKAKLRLDYIFVTEDLIDKVKSIEIINNEKTNLASDHFPVVMELQF